MCGLRGLNSLFLVTCYVHVNNFNNFDKRFIYRILFLLSKKAASDCIIMRGFQAQTKEEEVNLLN